MQLSSYYASSRNFLFPFISHSLSLQLHHISPPNCLCKCLILSLYFSSNATSTVNYKSAFSFFKTQSWCSVRKRKKNYFVESIHFSKQVSLQKNIFSTISHELKFTIISHSLSQRISISSCSSHKILIVVLIISIFCFFEFYIHQENGIFILPNSI